MPCPRTQSFATARNRSGNLDLDTWDTFGTDAESGAIVTKHLKSLSSYSLADLGETTLTLAIFFTSYSQSVLALKPALRSEKLRVVKGTLKSPRPNHKLLNC